MHWFSVQLIIHAPKHNYLHFGFITVYFGYIKSDMFKKIFINDLHIKMITEHKYPLK